MPAALPDTAIAAMLSAVSRRKQTLMAAAGSRVSGGTRRVLKLPGRGAFAMIVRAQSPAAVASGFAGLRIENRVVVTIELYGTPVDRLLFGDRLGRTCRRFFADGGLVPAVILEVNRAPGL